MLSVLGWDTTHPMGELAGEHDRRTVVVLRVCRRRFCRTHIYQSVAWDKSLLLASLQEDSKHGLLSLQMGFRDILVSRVRVCAFVSRLVVAQTYACGKYLLHQLFPSRPLPLKFCWNYERLFQDAQPILSVGGRGKGKDATFHGPPVKSIRIISLGSGPYGGSHGITLGPEDVLRTPRRVLVA